MADKPPPPPPADEGTDAEDPAKTQKQKERKKPPILRRKMIKGFGITHIILGVIVVIVAVVAVVMKAPILVTGAFNGIAFIIAGVFETKVATHKGRDWAIAQAVSALAIILFALELFFSAGYVMSHWRLQLAMADKANLTFPFPAQEDKLNDGEYEEFGLPTILMIVQVTFACVAGELGLYSLALVTVRYLRNHVFIARKEEEEPEPEPEKKPEDQKPAENAV